MYVCMYVSFYIIESSTHGVATTAQYFHNAQLAFGLIPFQKIKIAMTDDRNPATLAVRVGISSKDSVNCP